MYLLVYVFRVVQKVILNLLVNTSYYVVVNRASGVIFFRQNKTSANPYNIIIWY